MCGCGAIPTKVASELSPPPPKRQPIIADFGVLCWAIVDWCVILYAVSFQYLKNKILL